MVELRSPAEDELRATVRRLGDVLGDTIRELSGARALELVEGTRTEAISLRARRLEGGREAFAKRIAALSLAELEQLARAFTRYFHLINAAEEQHRIRTLRGRDRDDAPPDGSIAAACAELARQGASADDVRELLARLHVMPVLTAHPTEARRRTVLDHLAVVSDALDRLDDPRQGARERERTLEALREAVHASWVTEEARSARPTPHDEIRSALLVFERTLLDVTPAILRELEDGLAKHWPGEPFTVRPFLRWGSWLGGDRDGNPNVTSEVTRSAFEMQRSLVLARHLRDVESLGRELSVSTRRVRGPWPHDLTASLDEDRARLPEVAARARRAAAREPLREKLWYVRARLEATRGRDEGAYSDATGYLEDLRLIERSLCAQGLERIARGQLRDVRRRAEVFGFHLASLDLRQHSSVHAAATAELLGRAGTSGYSEMSESERVRLLSGLLERASVGVSRDRAGLSPATRELLATLDVIGRARRELGPEACERWIVSFTSEPSDLLEILFLARAAGLAPDELRPVPLLEQLEDLAKAGPFAQRMLEIEPIKTALRGELEVMIGYSDSGKQAGYFASAVALRRAQEALAKVAHERGVVLTVFHGRGGAIGRGGGPSNRAIRAQPPQALRGRLRETEQGETIAARFARPEIARRDLEQMIHAVLSSWRASPTTPEHDPVLDEAAHAARAAYEKVVGNEERLVRYAVAATPIQEVAELPIASRPATRKAGLTFKDLRAIPWVFSWNQSRHGLPGWFGLGSALAAILAKHGVERARSLYDELPFFKALVDNAQVALARSDIDVASFYARLADPQDRSLFDTIAAEHALTLEGTLAVTRSSELLESWPTLARTVKLRNPYVDVLSHSQIELLGRLRASTDEDERARIREALFITINGIAAGLQTVG